MAAIATSLPRAALTYGRLTDNVPLELSDGLLNYYHAKTLLLADGDLVSTWNNLSPRRSTTAYNMTAAGTARPTYRNGTNGINGRPCVSSEAGTVIMQDPSVSGGFSNPFTLFVVGEWTILQSRSFTDATGGNSFKMLNTAANKFAITRGGSTLTSTESNAVGVPFVAVCVFNGASSSINYNGVITTGTTGAGSALTSFVLFSTAGLPESSARLKIGTVGWYNRELSSADQLTLKTRLANDWGITVA